jgi:CRP-like cAMP-binding protein
MLDLGLCGLLIDFKPDRSSTAGPPIPQNQIEFPARRTIFHQNQTVDNVPIICDGWATATFKLSNGRRQILSILLPGEMITCRLVFEPQLHVSIDSITDGGYRTFDRAQLRSAMAHSPAIFNRVLAAYNAENGRADQLIVDLGRRSAPERVARLLVDLWDRLEKLNKTDGNSVEFPLRQTHIADATGLTTVYVNKVLGDFRHDGLADISDRSLQILDMTKLRKLAA